MLLHNCKYCATIIKKRKGKRIRVCEKCKERNKINAIEKRRVIWTLRKKVRETKNMEVILND